MQIQYLKMRKMFRNTAAGWRIDKELNQTLYRRIDVYSKYMKEENSEKIIEPDAYFHLALKGQMVNRCLSIYNQASANLFFSFVPLSLSPLPHFFSPIWEVFLRTMENAFNFVSFSEVFPLSSSLSFG